MGAVLLVLLPLLLAALPGAALAGAAPPPPPGLGIRLLDAPSERKDDPRARVYVVDRVGPGAVFVRHVEVSNGDDTAMDVLLYPAAATVSGGGFDIANRGTPGLVPQWTTVTPSTVHLEPGARAEATVTFRVAADAPSGEAYGAIVAERPPPGSNGVGVALRAGIRVYLSVGQSAEPASDFRVDSLTAARDVSGRPVVQAAVQNTGGRALDLGGTLRLSAGPGGVSAGPFKATLGTTLGIGQTGPVTVVLDKALPDGPWLATLELSSGLLKRKVQGTILFPSKAASTSAPVVPEEVPLYEKESVVVPVAVVLIVVVALALLLMALLTFLRRRRSKDDR